MFRLRTSVASASRSTGSCTLNSQRASRVTLKVLVIDDDRSALKALLRLLRALGYDASGARDQATAFELVLQSRPDLIVMDIMIEQHDGMRIARTLRAHPELIDVPIIALTGSPELVHADEQLFSAVLTKPCLSQDLLRAFESSLAAKSTQSVP
jgi:two-component system, sensor histidine kinase ChiS